MRSSAEIRKDIAVLETELAQAVEVETHAARAEIARIMQAHGMTVQDLLGGGHKHTRSKSGMPPPIKYRDNNGNEWTGMGRMPRWLKEAANPEQFRVKA